MSYCDCDVPREFRATSENAGEAHLYLRCRRCGGKAGRIPIDMESFTEHITDPNDLDPTTPEVAKSTVEHGQPTVSIHLNANDSPFMFVEDEQAQE